MRLAPLAFALSLLAAPALAQHAGHPAPAAPAAAPAVPAAEAPSTVALRAANMKMHQEMDIAYTGDADVDFAKAMIPHHQGAVEMANVQLAHGKDPKLRKLAREIVKAQEKEIKLMEAFLARKGAAH